MRTFIYQLRPIIMKEKEIGQWVTDLCTHFQEATGIPVQVEVGASPSEDLSPEISIALFRIIQETLANVYKHAEATHASLSLNFGDEAATLTIAHDGKDLYSHAQPAPPIPRP